MMSYCIKFMVFVLLLKVYEYGDHFHPLIKMALFCVHIYVVLDVGLAMVAYVARAVVGLQLEPHFDEPYLATSLQDFWGKRWNLMVTGILHQTVYLPVRSFFNRFLSRQLAALPAVMASFIVSGLMHELIFYYMGRLKPTWEVTWFFVIHGVLVCLELVVKRGVGRRLRIPTVVSGPLAIGVVVATSFWLFFPPFLRCDTEVRSCKEFVAFLELVPISNFTLKKLSSDGGHEQEAVGDHVVDATNGLDDAFSRASMLGQRWELQKLYCERDEERLSKVSTYYEVHGSVLVGEYPKGQMCEAV
nr:acyl-CoA--sterol O-acyltransferase 1-like [Tanacetum cinerariifolium]